MEYSKEELIGALNRSGYLLENRVFNTFLDLGFSAESNYYFPDGNTKKFREVDVVAVKTLDTHSINPSLPIVINLNFIVECINSPYPLGLFEYKGKQKGNTFGWNFKQTNGEQPLKEAFSISLGHILEDLEVLKEPSSRQYCGFKRKKPARKGETGELMAYHSDDFHNNLNKFLDVLAYQKQEISSLWEGRQGHTLRLDIFYPLLVISSDIYLIRQNLDLAINKVNKHRFLIDKGRKQVNIDILTEKILQNFLEKKTAEAKYIARKLYKSLEEEKFYFKF